MNAPFPLPHPASDEFEQFQRLKLELIEAFFDLDVSLEDWIHDGNGKASGASTGCRLKELIAIEFPQSIASKAQVSRFAKLSAELDGVIKVRNMVIHSRASFGIAAECPVIFLQPVDHDLRQTGFFAHVTAAHISSAIDKARSTAKTLNAWRRQRDNRLPAETGSATVLDRTDEQA